MEEILYYSNLFDYYKNLLTVTQCTYFEDYYFNNLSLTEIAENHHVSKNAISKTLKEVNSKLDDFETKLHLYSNKENIKNLLSKADFLKIEEYI